jgi:hypothetical protein
MATTIRALIYARGEVSFVKFLFLPTWFVKPLEVNFSCFAKIIWMPSWFAKLFELLLHGINAANNWFCDSLLALVTKRRGKCVHMFQISCNLIVYLAIFM